MSQQDRKISVADEETNQYIRHAIGNKEDAAVETGTTTKSIMAYIKGALTLHLVPTKDATTDVAMSDVVGKKDDTAVETTTTTKSLMAYLKGVLNLHLVPAKDATTDTVMNEVVGKKDDTERAAVGTNRSLMSYLKHVITSLVVPSADDTTAAASKTLRMQIGRSDDAAVGSTWATTDTAMGGIRELVDRSTSVNTTTTTGVIVEDTSTGTPKIVTAASSGSANTFGSWVEIDASTSADSWICGFTCVSDEDGTRLTAVIEIGTGVGASEVTKIRVSKRYNSCYAYDGGGGSVALFEFNLEYNLPIPIKVAAGTRIAVQMADSKAGAVNYLVGLQYYQGLE